MTSSCALWFAIFICLLLPTKATTVDDSAAVWIEDIPAEVLRAMKIEHSVDRIGDLIKGTLADAGSTQPIIFDEAKNRRLIGYSVVHVVTASPRRNHQQWQTRTISALALRVRPAPTHSR